IACRPSRSPQVSIPGRSRRTTTVCLHRHRLALAMPEIRASQAAVGSLLLARMRVYRPVIGALSQSGDAALIADYEGAQTLLRDAQAERTPTGFPLCLREGPTRRLRSNICSRIR